MIITEGVQALRHDFTIPLAPGKELPRFAWSYLLDVGSPLLIDAGVAASAPAIQSALASCPHQGNAMLCFTHAHPDHIGSAAILCKEQSLQTLAHAKERAWIEDPTHQCQERPVPGFSTLVAGGVPITRVLQDGEVIAFFDDAPVRALHTPGHAPGHLSMYVEARHLLIAGDALPLPGDIPNWENVPELRASIQTLAALPLEILCSAWDETIFFADDIPQRIAQSLAWVDAVDQAVRQEAPEICTAETARTIAPAMAARLELPPHCVNPLFVRTIQAHLDT